MSQVTKLVLLTLILALAQSGIAQIDDNFGDGDFTFNPTWSGDNSKFTVAAAELWLNAPAVTDAAFLSTQSTVMINTNWEFYNRMVFNPSSSNFCRFYLVSDQKNFNATNINGYYVELGRLSDEISLYKVVNGISTRIIDGTDNMLNSAACTTRVKVTRTGSLWELLVDSLGGTSFVSLGTFNDASVTETYFTGTYCKYTSTRSDKFFFDDVLATGTNWGDIGGPYVINHSANSNMLSIQLNEPVLSSDLMLSNFSLDHGLSVLSVSEDNLDCKKLNITASGAFVPNTLYHLGITTLHDLSGNITNSISHPFLIHTAVPGEVVINEIMADPTPQNGLPDAEFIELRNNSIYPISIDQWTLLVGTTVKILPPYTIAPNDFVMIADVADTVLFGASIKKIGIPSFPGLTNGGVNIAILDTGNVQIDAADYNLSWYHDPNRDDGGFTLERINPSDLCLQGENWRASLAFAGGTPGTENAVYDTTDLPVNINTFFIDSIHVLVVFNQSMDPSGLVLGNFNLQNLTGLQVLSNDSCLLTLSSPLTSNTIFNLTVSPPVADCEGNVLNAPIVVNVVNYIPQLFDVLIHELMMDETPGIGLPLSEYIELRNTQLFPLNLSGWTLVVNGSNYLLGNYILPADSFILLVHENNTLLFPGINIGGITAFGGITNESGIVELYHSNGMLFHSMKYSIRFYDVPGKDNGGWSLEMIDPSRPCLRNINWTASNDPSGGTPGRKNSYSIPINDLSKPHAIKTGISLSNDTLILYFDEPVLPASFSLADISLSAGIPTYLTYSSVLLDEYKLILQNSILPDSNYWIRLSGLTDCAGNMLVTDTLPYSIPVVPANFEIVINEVLADPTSSCIDYVEIYNRGTHAFDLSQMIMGEGDTSSHLLTTYSAIHPQSVLLHPGEYIFISEDHERVMNCYHTPDSTSYWDIVSLPDFSNASGTVGISTYNQQWLDMFAYTDQMHFSVLGSTDGVSLERIDLNGVTQNSMNWHSAASTVGFGTPGYQNSQFSPDAIISDDFTIEPEIFSPDNDGYHDYATIYYELANGGYLATLRIYDQAGRLEKFLVNNETLSTSGSFVWDGTNDKGGKVNVGIHIIYFELIGINGDILQFKKPVVVGTKL
jgi:hypothetical protein